MSRTDRAGIDTRRPLHYPAPGARWGCL